MTNTGLWDSVCITDKAQTKPFQKAGGFKGTAIKPYWLIRRATEVFGAIGYRWGFDEVEHLISNGIWFSKVRLWYIHPSTENKRCEVEQWGATVLAGRNSKGEFIDEEAAKKSLTDGLTKCLSYIGFAGDVHMGVFDDSKYIENTPPRGKKDNPATEDMQIIRGEEEPMSAAEEMDKLQNEPAKVAVAPPEYRMRYLNGDEDFCKTLKALNDLMRFTLSNMPNKEDRAKFVDMNKGLGDDFYKAGKQAAWAEIGKLVFAEVK